MPRHSLLLIETLAMPTKAAVMTADLLLKQTA
jgi:hypothetical protein